MNAEIVKICKKCGPLTIEQVFAFKNEYMRCKRCRQEYKTSLRKRDPELTREIDKKRNILIRDPSLKILKCAFCKEDKDVSFFAESMLNIRVPYCKSCWQKKAQTYRMKYKSRLDKSERDRRYLKLYGITLEQYNAMEISQNKLCKICGNPQSQKKNGEIMFLHVDHCHKTGKIRDLLCNRCNVGLAFFYESEKVLLEAVEYLKRHRSS